MLDVCSVTEMRVIWFFVRLEPCLLSGKLLSRWGFIAVANIVLDVPVVLHEVVSVFE